MPRSDPRPDVRGWIALAWAVAILLPYAVMIARARGGRLMAALAAWIY